MLFWASRKWLPFSPTRKKILTVIPIWILFWVILFIVVFFSEPQKIVWNVWWNKFWILILIREYELFPFPSFFFFFFALKFSSIYILKLIIFFFLMFLFQMFSNTYCKYTFVILFEYVFQRLCKNILYKTIIDLFFRLPVYLNNVPIYVVFGHRFKCFSWAHTLCQHVNVHEKTPVLQLPVCVRRKSYQREKNISLTIY